VDATSPLEPGTRPARTWFWLILAGVGAAGIVVSGVLAAVYQSFVDTIVVLLIGWPLVGAVLVVRRPGNAIGKLMVAFAALFGISLTAEFMVALSDDGIVIPAVDLFTWLALVVITPIMTVVVFLIALFPSGQLESDWLRWPLRITAVLTVIGGIGRAILPVTSTSGDTTLVNPWAIEQLAPLAPIDPIGFNLILIVLGLAAVDLIIRWRRSKGTERLQMRALALAIGVFAVGVTGTAVLLFLGWEGTRLTIAENLVWVTGLASLPIAIGVAVARYRLYEIDRLISRTVTYGVLVVLLAGLYAGAVFVLRSLLPIEGPLPIAASTLAVVAVFTPLRRRIQERVDRRFNRAKYDAERVIDDLNMRIRDTVDHDQIIEDLVGAVSTAMAPQTVAVWVREKRPAT